MARNRKAKAPTQLQLSLPSPYLSVADVAALIGVPKSFIYRRTARGHADPIPHYRLGGHLRFKLDEIEAWIESHKCDPPAPAQALVAATRQRGTASTRQRLVRRNPPL